MQANAVAGYATAMCACRYHGYEGCKTAADICCPELVSCDRKRECNMQHMHHVCMLHAIWGTSASREAMP